VIVAAKTARPPPDPAQRASKPEKSLLVRPVRLAWASGGYRVGEPLADSKRSRRGIDIVSKQKPVFEAPAPVESGVLGRERDFCCEFNERPKGVTIL